MFGQHHRYRAAIVGESGLLHFDKEPVFLFAVVAFIREIAEEPAEIRHILTGDRAAGSQFLSQVLQ